jgi:glycine oxidase
MEHSVDVLIVGGGIIGLTTGYFLAREGVRVRILDKGDLGQEASWAGAGIIPRGNPDAARTPFDQLRALGDSEFAALSAELQASTGIDNGYRRCGGLVLLPAGSPSEEWHGEGVSTIRLTEEEARRLEPSLAAGLGPAVQIPMAQVRNPRHVKALILACQTLGVELSPGCAVHSFVMQGGRIEGVKTSAGIVRGNKLVLATGAWTDPLLEPLGWQPGIHPVRGQIALLQPGKLLLQRIIIEGSRYLVPRPDGRVLVGSTEENVGFDKRTTTTAIHDLLELAISLVPALGEAALERSWAGLRPGSPDGLPFLGWLPGVANLCVAAGHFRSGIQLSVGTGLLLRDLLLGRPTSIAAEPFRLDRFIDAACGLASDKR